ncbi:4a-hydroxytetrahydrobiopterin dehydratase [Pontibacter toksunensis]|uniref:Putative pterin-4-alpha-carbinolamine dehydratase n=1 Tax=Pontibacter toksunensis TaxID=1332631 RepID=A0ABW6C0D8_9BACT
MRRHRRRESPALISDTWNYSQRTVDDSLGFTRDFTDTVSQEMLDEERIEMKRKKEQEQREEQKMLRREFTFPDFRAAMEFANKVGDIAEEEGHHPELHISYGKVVVELWTHDIGGVSEDDFIVAAKIDKITL